MMLYQYIFFFHNKSSSTLQFIKSTSSDLQTLLRYLNGTVDTVLKDGRGGQSSLSDGADG